MTAKFGFIGCGNMGGALASAVAKTVGGANILLCDRFSEKVESLAMSTGARASSVAEIAETCDFIFLGVKPQGFESLFTELSPCLRTRGTPFVLVSMAAGISIGAVEKMADMQVSVIRIMPNTPVSVGEGMILYCANDRVSEDQIATFCTALSKAGTLDAIPEDKIDAASALSGCGPAFVYLFAEALADGAVSCGLARDKANLYAAQTLVGAAELLLQSGRHAGELKDAVCSPGGTTIAGVRALEQGGFRASAMNAVIAAYEKTLMLKK
ncbi:MAG: pyrroline-5-carboxylate reductase [Ruminococcaceae bacterium]|nr:pyrroline-5-carboxylate reductase [Oscillospiraceae bacterium]